MLAALFASIDAVVKGSQNGFDLPKYFNIGYQEWYDLIVSGILM